MTEDKTKIRFVKKEDRDEILSFLHSENFAPSRSNPIDNITASVFAYQDATNNHGKPFGLVLENESNRIVGYMGFLAMKMIESGQEKIHLQSSGAVINKNYPGYFKKFLEKFTRSSRKFHPV